MACVNSNHHQTKISHTSPLAHTEIREPKKPTMNALTGIIITPDTVPQFVIPRKRPTRLQERKASTSAEDTSSTTPEDTTYGSGCLLAPSLLHLQTKKTPYGFSFLSESPTTSRKESLYRKKTIHQTSEQNLSVKPFDRLYDMPSPTSSDSGSMYDWSSHSPCSRSSLSPANSPKITKHDIDSRNMSLSSSQSHGHLYSIPADRVVLVPPKSSSNPSTPNVIRANNIDSRRSSMPVLGNNIKYKRTRSRSLRGEQPEKLHLHCMRRRSVIRDLGEVHMRLTYYRQSECLEVEIIRAENLGGSVYVGPMNPILKLSLSPEKTHQKHKTINMKGTRDPQFNQTFLFNNLKPLQLLHLDLKIKVLSKRSNLRRAEHVGDIVQPLGFLVHGDSHIIMVNVKPCSPQTAISTLTVSLCLKPKNLMLTIIKADDLARCSIAGSPDPYVDIEVTESIGEELKVQTYQTQARRGSVNPVFKEAFSIPIANSTNAQELTILLVVRDHDYILHDSNIGHVRLGVGMTASEHVESWNKVFRKPGQSVTMKCDLCVMPIDD